MRRIGFTVEPEFSFEEKTVPLEHYRTYGPVVQYQTEFKIGRESYKPSVYVPKSWFRKGKGQADRFPSRVVVTITVPTDVPWDEE